MVLGLQIIVGFRSSGEFWFLSSRTFYLNWWWVVVVLGWVVGGGGFGVSV